MNLSRRSFLRSSAVGGCGLAVPSSWAFAEGAGGAAPGALARTGVALYTVRDLMKDPGATLKAIANMGYTCVEGGILPNLDSAIKAAGLKQLSACAPT